MQKSLKAVLKEENKLNLIFLTKVIYLHSDTHWTKFGSQLWLNELIIRLQLAIKYKRSGILL